MIETYLRNRLLQAQLSLDQLLSLMRLQVQGVSLHTTRQGTTLNVVLEPNTDEGRLLPVLGTTGLAQLLVDTYGLVDPVNGLPLIVVAAPNRTLTAIRRKSQPTPPQQSSSPPVVEHSYSPYPE